MATKKKVKRPNPMFGRAGLKKNGYAKGGKLK